MPFKIIRNDITKVKADAIVNTANPKLVYASGTDAAIYKAAGADQLLAERKKIGEIERGQVAVTPALALSAKYIIHTVGPSWIDGNHGEFDTLSACYDNSLEKAAELKCKSIAFPLIATGVYGFPKDRALQIAITVISRFLLLNEMDVILVVFDRHAFELSGKLFRDADAFIDENYVSTQRKKEYHENISGGRFENINRRRKQNQSDGDGQKINESDILLAESVCMDSAPYTVFFEFLDAVSEISAGSMGRTFRALRLISDFLKKQGLTELNADLSLLKVKSAPVRVIPPYSQDELQRAIDEIALSTPAGIRNKAIILLAFETGLRSVDIRHLKLSDVDWENAMLHIVQSKTGSPLTLPLNGIVMNAIADYKNGRISHSDMAEISEIHKLADVRKQEVLFIPIEHMQLILKQPDLSMKTGIRDRFFLSLLYDSGCRNQEILDLRVKDFAITRNGEAELHIIGKGRKYRVTPISRGVTKMFYDYCAIYHPEIEKAYESYLFYTVRNGITCQMSPDNVQRFLRSYEESARKTEPELLHLHPHLFRHTRAMHLYMAGVPLPLIAEWLGHSRMETTQIYAQASIEMKRKASEKLAESDSAIFKGDVAFKYTDDEVLKKLSGLK